MTICYRVYCAAVGNCCAAFFYHVRGRAAAQLRGNIARVLCETACIKRFIMRRECAVVVIFFLCDFVSFCFSVCSDYIMLSLLFLATNLQWEKER